MRNLIWHSSITVIKNRFKLVHRPAQVICFTCSLRKSRSTLWFYFRQMHNLGYLMTSTWHDQSNCGYYDFLFFPPIVLGLTKPDSNSLTRSKWIFNFYAVQHHRVFGKISPRETAFQKLRTCCNIHKNTRSDLSSPLVDSPVWLMILAYM